MNIQKVVEKFNSETMKLDNIKSEFCVSPEKDFTRDRKISFASLIRSILSFGGGTLTSELLKINKFTPDLPTSSAFVQQRDKVSPRAFSTLFSMINKNLIRISDITAIAQWRLTEATSMYQQILRIKIRL